MCLYTGIALALARATADSTYYVFNAHAATGVCPLFSIESPRISFYAIIMREALEYRARRGAREQNAISRRENKLCFRRDAPRVTRE